jgi:hypothetical protein
MKDSKPEDLWFNFSKHPQASAELLHKLVLLSQPIGEKDEARKVFDNSYEEDLDERMEMFPRFKGLINKKLIEIRFAVAQHPSTYIVTLQRLGEDENYSVRSEAIQRLNL